MGILVKELYVSAFIDQSVVNDQVPDQRPKKMAGDGKTGRARRLFGHSRGRQGAKGSGRLGRVWTGHLLG